MGAWATLLRYALLWQSKLLDKGANHILPNCNSLRQSWYVSGVAIAINLVI